MTSSTTAKPRALRGYPADTHSADLYRDAAPDVATAWRCMADGLMALRSDAELPLQELVMRQVLDLGMAFRIAGDADERDWQLSPMPLIIGAQEWAGVERGLIQRARLLEALASDLYGPARVVSEGHVPAALVAGSHFFARPMQGMKERKGNFLKVYAADLVRGPGGEWQVTADRVRLANGIGYALENRLALSRVTGTLLGDIRTRRLATFFSDMRAGLARECARENPRIALLTPGRLNQSYPEQAHLARYLGFPLVEGRDLSASDGRVYVRTIAGPKRIDAVWRWLNTNALDPLHFDSRQRLGVPDLFSAWKNGEVELANWPGAEVVEAPAFAAYLPRLCEELLGEAPLLAGIPTWWCGEPDGAKAVAARYDSLLIAPAFGHPVEGLPDGRAVNPAYLEPEACEALRAAMARRPIDYCGQTPAHASTTPALIQERFVPRNFTLRAFVARGAHGEWVVMPGGFARLSTTGDMVSTLMGASDLSADVCVIETADTPTQPLITRLAAPAVQRGGAIIASQAADNLFWFGRYVERAENTVRVVRAVLGSTIEADAGAGHNPDVLERLRRLLVEWSALKSGEVHLPVPEACRAALMGTDRNGSMVALIDSIRGSGLTLRDRFTTDFWRVASRPMPAFEGHRPGMLMRGARELVERLAALSGLIAENFTRGPAWHFLDCGRRLERAISLCETVAAFQSAGEAPEALGMLLDLYDSQITYRARYLSGPRRDPVLDLLLLDPENPRSLAYQAQAMVDHLTALPRLNEDNMPEAPLLEARALLAPLTTRTIAECDGTLLADTKARLLKLSELIATRYFLQFEKAGVAAQGTFLA